MWTLAFLIPVLTKKKTLEKKIYVSTKTKQKKEKFNNPSFSNCIEENTEGVEKRHIQTYTETFKYL